MFQGYDQTTVDFMWGIRFNNDRDWFMAHKQEYIDHFYQPTKDLAAQLYDGLHAAFPDEPLICKVSRIYRDARRLHGRGPYKDHLWLSLRAGDEDWTGKPTFWFELAPEYYSYGLGFWCPKASLMETYRKHIDRDPAELSKLVRKFNKQDHLQLGGEDYARPKGDPSDLLKPWYNKKHLSLSYEVPLDDRIFTPELADDILASFKDLMPFYRFFNQVLSEVPESER